MKKHKKKAQRIKLILEFTLFGLILGVIEDLIALKFATGEPITWKIVGILIIVTIPFAIISELVVDNIDFTNIIHKLFFKKEESNQKG